MLHIQWLKNEDKLVYVNAEKDLVAMEKQLGLRGLQKVAEHLHKEPTKGCLMLSGSRRTTALLFILDLLFDEHIEIDENIFIYRGEVAECYVLYWIAE